MSFPPHEVYSRCLLGVHFGYPLWTPQLKTQLCESYQLEGLKIGDVGIVSPKNGSFDVLFNITLPRDEQPYPELVPEDFIPVTLDQQRDLDTQRHAVSPTHGVFPCASVQLVSAQVHNCDQRPSKANYEFSLSMGDGAVLVLPEGAESCDLHNEKSLLGEAIRCGVDWYQIATEQAGRLINNDSLYLITGFHKARSWSLGATNQNCSTIQNPRSLKFDVGQIHNNSVTAQAYRWGVVQGFMGRVGPESPYEIPNCIANERRRGVNQTVFVRGFRITVNKILLLKLVYVETPQGTFGGVGTYVNNLLWGGPSESTQSGTHTATDKTVDQDFSMHHSRLYTETRMSINRVPDVFQTFHPGDLINQYMLKKEPRAKVAITHDSLWIEMLQMGLLELADFSREERLEEVVSRNYRITEEDGAVYLQGGRVLQSSPHKYPTMLPSSVLTGRIKGPRISDSDSVGANFPGPSDDVRKDFVRHIPTFATPSEQPQTPDLITATEGNRWSNSDSDVERNTAAAVMSTGLADTASDASWGVSGLWDATVYSATKANGPGSHRTIRASSAMSQSSTLSLKDSINSASTTPATKRLRDNISPSLTDSSHPLSPSDVASSSYQHPPGPQGPSYTAVCDADPSGYRSPIGQDDIVIAVMGLTGAGKSLFINMAAGRTEVVVGNDLKSKTQEVQHVRCLHPDGRRNIVLVDTPGFDDTARSDAEILRSIADWLKAAYQNKIKLSGLLYLHRISDVRMAGTPLRNLSVFKDLCGDDNMRNIILVTTMWDEVEEQSVGSKMEEVLLSDFWADMIRLGSRACRFQGTCESAWEIIDCLDLEASGERRKPLQIQREMVDRGLRLPETTAARTLIRALTQFAGEAKKVWTKLRNKSRRKTTPRVPPVGHRLRHVPSRSSTPSRSEAGWSVVSSPGSSGIISRGCTPPSSPAESNLSGCSINGRQDTLLAAIRVLGLAHQMADIAHIPILRGIIGTALRIAQLIQELGGTHHAIIQVIESSGWLLDEIALYAMRCELTRDMKRALNSFKRELNHLQKLVIEISGRSRITGLLLHDADVQTITACTTSIKTVYDKLEIKFAMENREAIARLEYQFMALSESTLLRKCECGMLAASRVEAQENGQPSTSTCQPCDS